MNPRTPLGLDNAPIWCTMNAAGREDKATLRSDPSARPGAETRARPGRSSDRPALLPPLVLALHALNLPALIMPQPAPFTVYGKTLVKQNRCAIWQDRRGSGGADRRSSGAEWRYNHGGRGGTPDFRQSRRSRPQMAQMDTDQDKSRTPNPHLRRSAPSADTPGRSDGGGGSAECRPEARTTIAAAARSECSLFPITIAESARGGPDTERKLGATSGLNALVCLCVPRFAPLRHSAYMPWIGSCARACAPGSPGDHPLTASDRRCATHPRPPGSNSSATPRGVPGPARGRARL